MNAGRFFPSGEGGECGLCPRRCRPSAGESGQCRVRFNRGEKLPFYGFVTALAVDPIEKKPLYHFRPGTDILSAGFVGCNLHCPFCQNWRISQNSHTDGRFYSPAELAAAAPKKTGQSAIAYTYSEPLVHIEFLLDCMKEAQKAGTANVLVSNGCINPEAAAEVLALTSAANIDLKCFSEETYAKVLGGKLSTVTDFIRMAVEKGVHLELTTLVVPGLNDSREELGKCRDFIAELQTQGSIVPWHLSAYHPNWKWNAPPTDPAFLVNVAGQTREKLPYVYTGNITPFDRSFNDTLCPGCGKTLISRRAYKADTSGLSRKTGNGKPLYFCTFCGQRAPVT
ncbi:MAG: AmmeMemoRadiSam system radical SAM enzyme [Treponema sp.]|nr:AmmeMemoRadiSam system radical SAM enzyme [Treponema sp.]